MPAKATPRHLLMTFLALQHMKALLESSLPFLQQMASVLSPTEPHVKLLAGWTLLMGLPYREVHHMMTANQALEQVSWITCLYTGCTIRV